MIDDVRSTARSYFADAPPAHDWRHVERVVALAETLADRHPDPVDREVLRLAVWLHDIGRAREDRGEIDDHAAWGAPEAGRICRDHDLDPGTIERVQHCVRAHRYSTGVEPETAEAKLVSDADDLDALGAVGIARVFAHGGAVGSPMHGPEPAADGELSVEGEPSPGGDGSTDGASAADEDEPAADGDGPQAGATQRAHFAEKILALPDRMYTDAGGELAADRAAFVRTFLERFDAEVAGAE